MKLRAQRIHLMGSSNRNIDGFEKEPKNVFQNSFMKSQANYNKTAHSLPSFEPNESKTAKPYKGTHFQQQTLRWNSKNKKIGSETEWKLQPTAERLDYSKLLNQQVSDLSAEFKGKDVNMFKLNELKKTFVNNNRKRRNIQNYFDKYAKEGSIGVQQMKNIVRQYGYDITEDEAKIIFRLSGAKQNNLGINQFIDLMTKDNIYFRTLKIDGAFGKARTHFEEKIHLVLKNKFHQLKQAFRIYRMRGEDVDSQKFNYVMKKLDINDLVISKSQRQQVFRKFSDQNNVFNPERLLCALVEQQYTFKPTFPPKLSEFQSNIKAYEQDLAKKNSKDQIFNFKTISNKQYLYQFGKAQQVLKQLKKIPQKSQLISQSDLLLTKQQIRQKVQSLLQKNGINFNKQDYQCFISYLDFDANNRISSRQLKQFINQPPNKSSERFQRRIRTVPPQHLSQGNIYDQETALHSLAQVKAKKYDTDMRQLFKEFDKDKDGYLSRPEFKDKISNLSVLQNWQVENLVNYFDPDGKGYVNFNQFATKYTKGDRQPQNITESFIKPKSQSQWISTKRSFIKDSNAYTYNMPTKYSAWPQRLKRADFSLIQPPEKAGQYITQQQRFKINQKHSFAQQVKNQKHRIYQNRLKKLAAWNQTNNQRINKIEEQHLKRVQANDYIMRLTKEGYEQRCNRQ